MNMINLSPRDYQKKIFETAKEKNTLVVLPTGLGKTLIALMLSVDRLTKFPRKRILMLAPTKPLVEQHYEYFKSNLPELFADLQFFTGELSAEKRKKIFQTAEIIFSTPQCIANDISHYLYDLKDVSLLIIDEAHRCLKNYDYTKIVKKYKDQAEDRLILGLTASPGSDSDKINEICNHLEIEEIELRTRDSEDVKNYLQEREYDKVEVPFPQEFIEIKVLLQRIWDSRVEQLKSRNLLFGPANKITLLRLQNTLVRRAAGKDFNAMMGMSLVAQAVKISHAIELLETQTLEGLDSYMKGLKEQAEAKATKAAQNLVNSAEFKAAEISLKILREKQIEHPKVEALAVIIEDIIKENSKAKVIIFSQFRDTASIVAKRLGKINDVKSAIFIGQAKKKDVGLSQKEQKNIINKFREGEINVLCATSIGEEGLDIPEVSAVIFYEPVPSAIRKIQRAGRTARLSKGRLIIMITKNTRDEINHYTAGSREKKMYKIIEKVKKDIKNRPKNLKDFM